MTIVVVTACLAGIAHSKIVAEALKKEGESRGYTVYVEEQGGHKITKKVTEEQIKEADVVIIANAISIANENRFEGKKVIKVPINKAIMNIKGTMDRAIELTRN